MKKLNGQVAIITGATSGMGKAIAEVFIKEGASLIISGRSSKRGIKLEKELRKINKNVLFVSGDISQSEQNKILVDAALSNFGKLNILSLNAGILGLGALTDLSLEKWHTTIDTNLSSIYYLCKYAIPEILKTGKGNIIINASIAAFKSFPNHPAYCASKAGAVALMKQIAIDYAPDLRANAICPGPVDTPLLTDSAQAFEEPEQAIDNARKKTLLKRLGEPQDIARLALFLASDDSSWITGTTINIDGGILIS